MKLKKLTALLLSIMMLTFVMTGCGSQTSTENQTEAEEATIAESEETDTETETADNSASISNPWTETDAEGMEEAVGVSFNVPDDAQNLQYSVDEADGIGQLIYNNADGLEICVRAQMTGEAEDISGMFYTWSNEEDCQISYCDGKVMQATADGQTVEVCTWFDVVPGISYSVSVCAEDLDGFDITAIAEQVFYEVQGDSVGDDYLALCGTYTSDYDGSTITLNEDGTVDVSLFRLADLEGTAYGPEDGILTFNVTDPSEGDMTLTFDTGSNVLTVTDSTWDLLENDTTFTFDTFEAAN